VKETLENIDRITARGGPELQQILVNIKSITEDVKQMMASQGGKDGQSGELRQTIERVNRASASLESALGHIDSVAGRIDRGEGTIGS